MPAFLYDAGTVANRGVHDISPLLSSRTAVFPGDTPLTIRRVLSFGEGGNLELSSIETTVHLGAHADAPLHYHRNGVGIDRRDPLLYVGPAQVIHVAQARGRRIRPSDLGSTPITAPRVLFRTASFPDPDRWNADFASLSAALSAFGAVQFNEFLLRCTAPPYELTVFKDGRAIVKGTEDASVARSVYSKMVGS